MQEPGIPVTFGYLSDAHDAHGKAGEIHIAYGPGETGLPRAAASTTTTRSRGFFDRLKNDGITKDNTLFVVTVEEGDHFAGTAPDAAVRRRHGRPAPTAQRATRHRGQRRPEAARRDLQREPRHERDDELQRPLRPGAERLRHRQPGARLVDRAHARAGDGRHEREEPALGQAGEPVRGDGRPGRGEDPPHVDRRPDAAADVHAVRAGRLLPERLVDGAVREQRPERLRVPAEHGALRRRRSRGTTAASSRRSATRGSAGSGRGSRRRASTDKVWTDHTDVRPTILALLGLKDDYVSDGRVDTEFLKGDAMPKSLNGRQGRGARRRPGRRSTRRSGRSRPTRSPRRPGALASHTLRRRHVHEDRERDPGSDAERDALASKIRLALWNAEFNGQKIDEKHAKNWIGLANDLLGRAHALAAKFQSEPAEREGARRRSSHIVVIYEENHSFDNLYGGWEGVNGLANADAAHTTQVNQAGNPYACLKQNDVNLTSPAAAGDLHGLDAGHAGRHVHEPLHERAVQDRRPTSRRPTSTCPPSRRVFGPAERPAEERPERAPRRLHPRPRAPLLPGAVPARTAGTQNRYVTGSDAIGLTMGYYDTKALPIYAYLHVEGPSRLRDRGQLLPGLVRRLVPEPSVADRSGVTGLERRSERRRRRRPALRRRCQRDAEQLPAVRLAARRAGQGHAADTVLQPGRRRGRRCSRRSRAATTPSTRRSRSISRSRRDGAHAPASARSRGSRSATS